MQIFLLGLFIALYVHDATTLITERSADGTVRGVEALPQDLWPGLGPIPVALIVLGPKLLMALLYQTQCMRTRRLLGTTQGHRSLRRLERFTSAMPLLLLLLFVNDLTCGALRVVRLALQHTVLIDELVVLLPTLGAMVLAWWSYYPVDRRLREAVIFRNADAGKPVYPLLDRGAYVSLQLRHQFGLLLPPLLVIFAWSESLVLLGPDFHATLSTAAVLTLTPIGVLAVFLLTPLIIRHVWHTTPLADGEVRDRMLKLCDMHRIRVRELLLWRTGGGMVNAAVTGLVRFVRYILLSDGLLDQVPPRGVEAVMAHEIAHVKCKHIIWMGAILLVALGTFELIAHAALDMAINSGALESASQYGLNLQDPQQRTLITALPVFGLTMLLFGWVSRRIERQADVFAARHLAMTADEKAYDDLANQVFDQDAVDTMVHALQRVAELNHAPIHRPSWRHGSIAWRQQYLRSLVGQPINDVHADHVLRRVKAATTVCGALLVLLSLV